MLRYGMLYGPGTAYDRRGSTAADIVAGRVPLVEGATGMYSWLHVEDAASAAVAALERGAPGIYNVVDDEPAPQPEWLPVLARALRRRSARGGGGAAPPDAPEMSMHGASNAKAKRELGWRPRYASWREGFAASLQSLLKRGELLREASHRVAVQQRPPAHPGHAQRGQLGERRRLRQAHDVHRAADLGHEAAQRVRLPQADRVHAVGAGLEVGVRAPQRFGHELRPGSRGRRRRARDRRRRRPGR